MFLHRCQEIITLSFHALDIKRALLDYFQLFQKQYSQHDTDSSDTTSVQDPLISVRSSVAYGMHQQSICFDGTRAQYWELFVEFEPLK